MRFAPSRMMSGAIVSLSVKCSPALGSGPNNYREARATIVGRTLGVLCHVMGWLVPMYGAGKLESRNVREYETAAPVRPRQRPS